MYYVRLYARVLFQVRRPVTAAIPRSQGAASVGRGQLRQPCARRVKVLLMYRLGGCVVSRVQLPRHGVAPGCTAFREETVVLLQEVPPPPVFLRRLVLCRAVTYALVPAGT